MVLLFFVTEQNRVVPGITRIPAAVMITAFRPRFRLFLTSERNFTPMTLLNPSFEGLEQAQPLMLLRALLMIIIVSYRVRREARAALEFVRFTSLG